MSVNYIVSFVLFLSIWTAWGYFSSKVEQAEYTVLSTADEYEVREYPAHLVAQTTVTSTL